MKKTEVIAQFKQLLASPESCEYSDDMLKNLSGYTTNEALKKKNETPASEQKLLPQALSYKIYGEGTIENDALQQMKTSMRLPITKAGALMADAHTGYGLPIGGVLATDPDTVIPYAVGVDIACRMCMSIFDIPGNRLAGIKDKLKKNLVEHTVFGVGNTCRNHVDSSVFDLPEWKATPVMRTLQKLAYSQLGTSGGGNHFVEWGTLKVEIPDELLGIPTGEYLALLSHSGSRGFGAEIASHYSNLAMQITKLPKEARHLAWLNLNTEEGHDYWIAMQLAGEYASANHHEIHKKLTRACGLKVLKQLENHHNFAWKEVLPDGTEAIIHRKGATPAAISNLGIIPGNMVLPGFVVRGKGNTESLRSASHGAGRVMSRSKAFQNFSMSQVKKVLAYYGVELIGSDVDEAPMAYKNIFDVMEQQKELVDTLATFQPRIVRMADPDRHRRGDF